MRTTVRALSSSLTSEEPSLTLDGVNPHLSASFSLLRKKAEKEREVC
jgi:hypothetical protein